MIILLASLQDLIIAQLPEEYSDDFNQVEEEYMKIKHLKIYYKNIHILNIGEKEIYMSLIILIGVHSRDRKVFYRKIICIVKSIYTKDEISEELINLLDLEIIERYDKNSIVLNQNYVEYLKINQIL